MLALCSGTKPEAIDLETERLDGRVERVVARLGRATFTGKADTEMVPKLYKDYVARIADVLAQTLALVGAAESAGMPQLPPMPADTEALQAWHVDVLRLQHASMADALSGRRLDALADCVQIAITGHDASGKQLDLRNAEGLSAWLPTLSVSTGTCALLTAGPATGKTWLTSQVVMHSLHRALVPVVIKVEHLQKELTEHEAAFQAAPNWVDAHLQRTCEPPHYAMLHAAMEQRRVLLLIDGLDEAGAARARIETHVAEVLAPQGHTLLCTSRPAGLDAARFAAFHKLQLAPLTEAQQQAFLASRLGAARAVELKPYLRDKVPLDAESQRSVTANPLMLSMVASIAELRAGIDMPTTTAELYDVAASAMMSRAAEASDETTSLLRATFFEAHADKQRIITTTHVEAAARRLGKGAAAVAALRDLVLRDRLPLVRLLNADPLQMQAFHLSFQEFYAMRAIGEGGVALQSFGWDVWWANAVLMGVQVGGAAFGDAFVQVAKLPDAADGVPQAERWRVRVVAALAREGVPAAWLPTALEAA